MALRAVARLWELDPALGEGVARYPWVVDGVTLSEAVDGIAPEREAESEELARLALLASYDGALAGRIAGHAWVADGIETEEERGLLREFVNLLALT